ALAGALGSVAQKVITKQAEKATTQFAQNLEQALSANGATGEGAPAVDSDSLEEAAHVGAAPVGAAPVGAGKASAVGAMAPAAAGAAAASASVASNSASPQSGRRVAAAPSTPLAPTSVYAPDRWGRISAGLSAAS